IFESMNLIDQLVLRMPGGPLAQHLGAVPSERWGFAMVESPRGLLSHWLRLGPEGTIADWRVRSASHALWPALAEAVPGNIVPAGLPLAIRERSVEIEVLGEALLEEVRKLFRGSLKLRHLDLGSCNGCEGELAALLNPFHDVQRFGVDIVTSPRHADGLLVTGPVSRHLEEAMWLTDQATPRPRLLIAVGDCACDGGFCVDSFAVAGGASR